jgi:hypothetical protein
LQRAPILAGVIDVLATVLVAAGLAVAVWAGVAAARNRRVSGPQLLLVAAVELVLLVQAVVALVLLRERPGVDALTFVGYLLTAVLLLPVGTFWAIGERSRWGNGVLAVTGAVVSVLVLRLQQIWAGGG